MLDAVAAWHTAQTMKSGRVVLVSVGLSIASAAAFAEAPSDVGTHGASALVQAFTLRAAYHDRVEGGDSCGGTARDIVGYEPSEAGRYPVFVYLMGTRMKFNGPEAQKLTSEMAKRGFVAAAVDYDNAAYPYCSGMQGKAKCVFGGRGSALASMCAHPKADCDRGVVVSGFSQGANLAALAKNYEPRVRGAYLLGHGDRAANIIDVAACADDAATALPPSQMRSVNGEHDGFFGLRPDGVRRQLQKVLGVSCADGPNCLQPDGSGWLLIQDAELGDGSADHCYFFDAASGDCAKYRGLDPAWERGDAPWSLGPNLDWLAARVASAPTAQRPAPKAAAAEPRR